MTENISACVGCKYAEWFHERSNLGRCTHPETERYEAEQSERRRTMPAALRQTMPFSISIHRTDYYGFFECPTREDT